MLLCKHFRKHVANLILSKKQRFIWVALAVKPHLINWISVFHSIVKSDHVNYKVFWVEFRAVFNITSYI